MKILVTGAAGFIGSNLCQRLLKRGDEVVGVDNINDYYDVRLKYCRLRVILGVDITEESEWLRFYSSQIFTKFRFAKMGIEDNASIKSLFESEGFDVVVNLAAQAGVRYSLENPHQYITSNINGFINILEGCRHSNVKHLVYASSSSVYGLNAQVPFSESDNISHPVSLYAATKRSNELMAHTYSHLYQIPTTGLRFFTVYGAWGRPDMSPSLFMDAMLSRRPIKVFNNGDMLRDFTYIDDIVEGVTRVIDRPATPDPEWRAESHEACTSSAPYRIYNIGNSQPVKLMDFIETIESALATTAEKILLPMQPGDVYQTNANTDRLAEEFDFKPNTLLRDGIKETAKWHKEFYVDKIY